MKKIFTIFLAAVSFAALAAATPKNEPDVPVSMNRFIDNWFVGAGAGVNTILDNGNLGLAGLGVDVNVGKWFTPSVGFRLGWHGLNNKAKDTSNGWFAADNRFGYHFVHLDFMWDIMNTFRYNEKRLVSIVPMLHGGCIVTTYNGKTYSEFGYGAALQVGFRISKRLRANVEVAAILAREEAWRKAGTIICFPSATAGLQVNLGKTGFERRTQTITVTQTVTVPADCNHEALIKDLEKEIQRLNALKDKAAVVAKPQKIEGWVTYFQLDKSTLLERENFHLMDLVKILPDGATLTIVGHADKETGSRRRNAVLSEDRVNTVAKALTDLGFKGTIVKDAKGDTANPFDKPFPKNRCVTITVTLPE